MSEARMEPSKENRPPHVAELQPSPQLLGYYKQRLDGFEEERTELLKRVESCAVDKQELHRLEWEARQRGDEVRELQKALSDAHTYLFEERERLLVLQAENDELRLQEQEDRKRIAHLLALTQPVEQEVTYFRGARPDKMTVFPRSASAIPQPHGSQGVADAGGSNKNQRSGSPERVMRTVYLPSANTDAMMLKIESLQAQLNEQRQFSNERISALLSDRRIRDQDEEAARVAYNQRIDAQAAKLRRTEETLLATTKDLIVLRREKQEAQSRAVSADAALAQERRRAEDQIADIRREAGERNDQAREMAEANAEQYVNTFREQLKQREEELINLEGVHSAVKAQHEVRCAELEAKIAKLEDKSRELEHRRALDLEGFTADITNLRKSLIAVDRKLHQMRLIHRLEDDERLDAILDELERRAPSMPSDPGDVGSDAGSEGSATVGLRGDLAGLRVALNDIDARLENSKRKVPGAKKAPPAPAPGAAGKKKTPAKAPRRPESGRR